VWGAYSKSGALIWGKQDDRNESCRCSACTDMLALHAVQCTLLLFIIHVCVDFVILRITLPLYIN